MPARKAKRKRRYIGLWILGVLLLMVLAVRYVAPLRNYVRRTIVHHLINTYKPKPPGTPSLLTSPRMANYKVHGIDVSTYQSLIEWEKVKRAGFSFAFVKATEGVWLEDRYYELNWENAKDAGILRGAYHFFHPGRDPRLQAENFTTVVSLEKGDLPPVLDVEVTGGKNDKTLVKNVRTWLKIVEDYYGVQPILYTNYKFYIDYLHEDFADYPVWVAHYGVQKPRLHEVRSWSFWQYRDNGQIKGLTGFFDFNVFNGSMAQLSKLTIKRDMPARR